MFMLIAQINRTLICDLRISLPASLPYSRTSEPTPVNIIKKLNILKSYKIHFFNNSKLTDFISLIYSCLSGCQCGESPVVRIPRI